MSILQITNAMLQEWQSWPLDKKIAKGEQTILDWYKHWKGQVYVAFSGGKDSTAMLHMIRAVIKKHYPDAPPVIAVFNNTGLEFEELVAFVKTVDDVVIIRPKVTFDWILKNLGFPLLSKKISEAFQRIKATKSKIVLDKLMGITRQTLRNGKKVKAPIHLPDKWHYLLKTDIKLTNKCCKLLKKDPFHAFEKKTGLVPFIGTMASESEGRRENHVKYGCNAYDMKHPQSRPISHWYDTDVWDYIAAFNVPYCEIIYKEMGYKRTGCTFCAFGVHLEKGENRFQMQERTHPKKHKYIMEKRGMAKAMKTIGVNPYHEDDLMDLMGMEE